MRKLWTLFTICLVSMTFAVAPALAVDPPKVTLDRVEVASIQEYFQTAAKTKDKEGKEKTVKVGAIINTAYIFNIENPNKEPVMLDEFTFTIAFEGFEVNTVTSYEDAWIPGGKTNQLRVIATNEARPTMLSLLVGADNVEKLKEMGVKAPDLVAKWWMNISDFSFPIEIVNGTAVFKTEDGKTLRSTYTGTFGGK